MKVSLINYIKNKKFEIIREIIISVAISAIITGLINSYLDIKMDNRISHRQFINEIGRTFFDNEKYRKVSIAIEEEYLYDKRNFLTNITEYEIDDYLGLLNDIWLLYKDGFISQELVYRQFAYYFCITYNSDIVDEYRTKLKKEGFSDLMSYSFLEEVANELGLKSEDCKKF